jgi:hypothetical protein
MHLPVLAYAGPLLAFSAYRRVRRNIGRQAYRPLRLAIRSGVIALIFLVLLFWPAFDPQLALAMVAGACAGALLARLGVRLTRFETLPEGRYYTPNTALGVGLSLLFMARIGYRVVVVLPALQAASETGGGAALRGAMSGSRSALTMALLGLVLGYFFAYCLGILRRARLAATLPVERSAS